MKLNYRALGNIAITILLLIPGTSVAERTKARITAVRIYDEGSIDSSSSSIVIDTEQGSCVSGSISSPEPFNDTLLGLTVNNTYLSNLKIRKFWYTINNFDGAGHRLRATKFAPVGSLEVPARSSAEVLVLFVRSFDGSKFFSGSEDAISPDLGFRNVTLHIQGTIGQGRKVTISSSSAMSFRQVDRCS